MDIELIINYVLPFLLIFSIIYGVLENLKLFKRKIRTIISLLLSIFAIFYLRITFLENIIPILIYTLIILLGAITILGMIGIFKVPGTETSWLAGKKLLFAGLLLIIFIILASFSFPEIVPSREAILGILMLLLIFGAFIGAIYFVTKEK